MPVVRRRITHLEGDDAALSQQPVAQRHVANSIAGAITGAGKSPERGGGTPPTPPPELMAADATEA
jgi:hypothetical protein